MSADIFYHAPSTHQVVLGVLLSETGLLGASALHPEKQYTCITAPFTNIRNRLTAPEWAETGAFNLIGLQGVAVSREEDAQMFMRLYNGLNSLSAQFVPAAKSVELVTYPLVRLMVSENQAIRTVLADAFRDHVAEYGEAVEQRIRRTLKDFRIEDLIAPPPDAPAP